MENKKDLTIATVPVTIRVVEVGGKRMTLSVFRQIQMGGFITDEKENKADLLGWIDYNGAKHVLYSLDGCLKKEKVNKRRISNAVMLELENATKFAEIYRRQMIKNESVENRLRVAIEAHLTEKQICDQYNESYSAILTPDKQIFISV